MRLTFKSLLAGLLLWASLGTAAAGPFLSDTFKFDLPAGNARDSLQALADKTGLMIVYGSDDVFATHTNAVQGEMSYDEALRRMLVGTGLSYRIDDFAGRVTVLRRDAALQHLPARPHRGTQ